jgi:UDP-galactopyranose mutase
MYDYLIVGSGLFGSVFAQQATEAGYRCLVVEKNDHIGGNCYTKEVEGINVHVYGPHIFHTDNDKIWEYMNRWTRFNHYVNRPKVHFKDKLYSFPINLMTLNQLWGVKTPDEARARLDLVKVKNDFPKNLEEWILSQVGKEIYETFIEGYTTKQWNRHPSKLPASIVKRLPIRLTFDDNYFNDKYQGIPIGGYTPIFEKLLAGSEVLTGVDYFQERHLLSRLAKKTVYTGKLDQFFSYCLGRLEYRGLRFDTKVLDCPDFQGNAVINYTEKNIPYTRITEHRHFDLKKDGDKTVVTWEYPDDWDESKVPYYPVNDDANNKLRDQYKELAAQRPDVIFGGRLASYMYYDMHQVVASALYTWSKEKDK